MEGRGRFPAHRLGVLSRGARPVAICSPVTASSPATGPRAPHVAVAPQSTAALFFVSILAAVDRAAREFNVDVLRNGPNEEADSSGQRPIVDAFLAHRVAALAISAPDERVRRRRGDSRLRLRFGRELHGLFHLRRRLRAGKRGHGHAKSRRRLHRPSRARLCGNLLTRVPCRPPRRPPVRHGRPRPLPRRGRKPTPTSKPRPARARPPTSIEPRSAAAPPMRCSRRTGAGSATTPSTHPPAGCTEKPHPAASTCRLNLPAHRFTRANAAAALPS